MSFFSLRHFGVYVIPNCWMCRIWRQARLRHYPNSGVGSDLPYGLDEASLFKLAMEKRCVYCKSKKAKPYYAWGTRSCHVSLARLLSRVATLFTRF